MNKDLDRFNACKASIGQLLVKFDKQLTPTQRTALGRAWQSWSLLDRIGRERAKKIVHDELGALAADVVNELENFNREVR